jgi:hypothetical protein
MTTIKRRTAREEAPTTRSYMAEVELKLSSELSKSPASFGALMKGMEGAFPTDVLGLLCRLRDKGSASDAFVAECARSHNQLQGRMISIPQPSGSFKSDQEGLIIPEPHPLDYDWRFSQSSLYVFDDILGQLSSKHIGIFGAPTVFVHLSNAGKHPHLYDKNTTLIDHLLAAGYTGITQCDLFQHKISGKYDAVVADPPWYSEHYYAFIDGARDGLKTGGHLLISILPRLTRPSAVEDRQSVLVYAYSQGFDLYEVHHAALQYTSPPFELAALQAQGINLTDWRYGDLFIFTSTSRKSVSVPRLKVEDEVEWDSFPIGKTIVRVRRRKGRKKTLEFAPASPGGHLHLHSVSRRSPVRASIDLWTSRNLALRLSRTDYVCDVLSLITNGMTYKNAVIRVSTERQLDKMSESALGSVVNLLLKDAEVDDYV